MPDEKTGGADRLARILPAFEKQPQLIHRHAPSFIRQMDKTTGDQESAALKSFGDALQQSIMRNRYIPDAATAWIDISGRSKSLPTDR